MGFQPTRLWIVPARNHRPSVHAVGVLFPVRSCVTFRGFLVGVRWLDSSLSHLFSWNGECSILVFRSWSVLRLGGRRGLFWWNREGLDGALPFLRSFERVYSSLRWEMDRRKDPIDPVFEPGLSSCGATLSSGNPGISHHEQKGRRTWTTNVPIRRGEPPCAVGEAWNGRIAKLPNV